MAVSPDPAHHDVRVPVDRPVPARELVQPWVTDAGELTNLGVEEEFHVVDLESRELVAQGPRLLERLPTASFSDELHRSIVESNSPVCADLDTLGEQLIGSRRTLVAAAESL